MFTSNNPKSDFNFFDYLDKNIYNLNEKYPVPNSIINSEKNKANFSFSGRFGRGSANQPKTDETLEKKKTQELIDRRKVMKGMKNSK